MILTFEPFLRQKYKNISFSNLSIKANEKKPFLPSS